MLVYFIRHGESENNSKGVYSGQMNVHLSPLGIEQAQALVPFLSDKGIEKVYSSDLFRAAETAENAMPDREIVFDKRLREIDVGSLSGQSTREFRANNPDKVPFLNDRDYTPFGGENDAAVLARVSDFIEELAAEKLNTVAVFCHGGVIHTTLEYSLGASFPAWRTARPNCAVVAYELCEDKTMKLLSWNPLWNNKE